MTQSQSWPHHGLLHATLPGSCLGGMTSQTRTRQVRKNVRCQPPTNKNMKPSPHVRLQWVTQHPKQPATQTSHALCIESYLAGRDCSIDRPAASVGAPRHCGSTVCLTLRSWTQQTPGTGSIHQPSRLINILPIAHTPQPAATPSLPPPNTPLIAHLPRHTGQVPGGPGTHWVGAAASQQAASTAAREAAAVPAASAQPHLAEPQPVQQ